MKNNTAFQSVEVFSTCPQSVEAEGDAFLEKMDTLEIDQFRTIANIVQFVSESKKSHGTVTIPS